MKSLLLLLVLIPFQTHPLLSMNLLPGITPIKIFGISTLAYGILNQSQDEAVQIKNSGYKSFLPILILMFCTGQLIFGILVHGDIGANAMRSLISFTLFYFCITLLVNTEDKLRKVFIVCVVGMAWSSIYMFKEYIQFRNVFNGFRPRGSFGDSNYYSIASLIVIPMGFALIQSVQTKMKYIYIVFTIMIIGGLLVGQSRGGLIGFCLLGFIYWLNSKKMIKSMFKIILMAGLVALFLPDNFWIRIQKMSVKNTTEVSGDDLSNKRRVELPRAGYIMFLDNPILGVGPGNYKKQSIIYNPMLRDIGGPGIAHNTYIEILAEMGLGGALLFISIVLITLKNLRKVANFHEEKEFLYQAPLALKAGIFCYLFSAVFLSAQYSKYFWLCIFCSLVLAKINHHIVQTRSPQ